MNRTGKTRPTGRWDVSRRTVRRGAFQVLALLSLTASLGVVAMSVDLAVVSLTKTEMQNAVAAAALAASQEITAGVANAGANASGGNVSGAVSDANSISVAAARLMAQKVAALNGVYVDPERDVRFGKRVYSNGAFSIQWDVGPYNVVKVTARRDNAESGHGDSKLDLFFAGVTGEETASLTASAVAFVEARDIVMVLDYSGSMSDDSIFSAFPKLGQVNVEANMQDIWTALNPKNKGSLTAVPQWLVQSGSAGSGKPTVTTTFKNTSADVTSTGTLNSIQLTFSDGKTQTFSSLSGTSKTVAGSGTNQGKTIDEVWVKTPNSSAAWTKLVDSAANVKSKFGLTGSYPYASGSWDDYINFVRSNSTVNSAGYRRKYGGLTFVQYVLTQKLQYSQTHDLWKTPQYPFHAMREGATLFTEFLAGLEFGDHLGLVTYDEVARIETTLNDANIPESANLGADWLTLNYAAIDTIQRHKQAGHYAMYTNIADGLNKAKQLLDAKQRNGARPTVILMTDGQANRKVNGVSTPGGWNWENLTDYDGNGVANYTTNDEYKLCTFIMAKRLIDQGVTIHTLTVGAGADRDLMKAIAFAGNGEWIDCPGGSTIAEMEGQLLSAFGRIAANVPPPKLLNDPDAVP